MARDDEANAKTQEKPPAAEAPSRRALLLGAGVASSAALLNGGSAAASENAHNRVASANAIAYAKSGDDRQPFYGEHQSGIANPAPSSAIFVAFDVLATNHPDLQQLFKVLTRRIAFLTAGGDIPARDPLMPPPDSGMLGPEILPDNLTITVALGASLFDDRFGLSGLKPKKLATMERFPNDALDAAFCHGDLMLQFCANSSETNLHALRDIVRNMPGLLAIRWKMDGFLPPGTLTKTATNRNLMGFKDGTANIDSNDSAAMNDLVWAAAASDEPGWCRGGSYQVVRLIRITAERWDRTPLGEQQQIFGRDKRTGAPLGMKAETDIPDYNGVQGKTIAANAHMRLANPRTAATQANLILRRPYNFSREITKAGQLDLGLIFVCYQSDLDAGFRAVQARLNGEPLEEYIKPFGGGYFFVLPGARDAESYLGKELIERGPV